MMVERKTWAEFRQAKLLWWVNRMLHLFGWAIVCNVEQDGSISEVYPARVAYRGFSERDESDGFAGLTEYLQQEADQLASEAGCQGYRAPDARLS